MRFHEIALLVLVGSFAAGCGSAAGGSDSLPSGKAPAGGGGGSVSGGGLSGDAPSDSPSAPAAPNCTDGSKEFSEAGKFSFDVPAYATLTVEVWGAGGGGEASGASAPHATAGEASRFGASMIANGGLAGTYCCGGAGGTASGGDENLTGASGGGGVHYPAIGGQTPGGAAPKGGAGGSGATGPTDSCGGGDGSHGAAPGGGGAPTWSCQGTWWTGTGWGDAGGSGGAGGYASKKFARGAVARGAIEIVVGASGKGSRGQVSSGFPVTAKNPGSYTAGDGGVGRVKISWTCDATPAAETPK